MTQFHTDGCDVIFRDRDAVLLEHQRELAHFDAYAIGAGTALTEGPATIQRAPEPVLRPSARSDLKLGAAPMGFAGLPFQLAIERVDDVAFVRLQLVELAGLPDGEELQIGDDGK